MHVTVSTDIAAPAAFVFAQASDAAAYERQAIRRGASVQRLDGGTGAGPGAAWRFAFHFRGRDRELVVRLDRVERPTAIGARLESTGVRGRTLADLVALGRATTRLALSVEVEGTTLASKLVVQSLRLARGRIEERLRFRLEEWAREVEERWRRAGSPA